MSNLEELSRLRGEEFINNILSGKLVRDVLPDEAAEKFTGKNEAADYERFQKFCKTNLFKKIMEL